MHSYFVISSFRVVHETAGSDAVVSSSARGHHAQLLIGELMHLVHLAVDRRV